MNATIRENGDLRITVTRSERAFLRREHAALGDAFHSERYMCELFDDFLANSPYQWINPEDIGALTDAPILAILAPWEYDNGQVVTTVHRAWGYMAYALRSPQDDLATKGYCDFQAG